MKIAFISIQNFRSIAHAEVNCGKVNMFIGPNNCGKTNLFEAVEWFYTGKGDLGEISFLRDPGNAVEVRVGFNNVQNGITKMKNESNRTKVKNLVGDADEVVLLRRGSDVKKRLFVIDGVEKAPGTGFDSALNDFLPSFEYVSTKQYYDSVVKYDKKAPIGAMLSDVLAAILETSDQYKDFLHTFDRLFDDESSDIKIKFDELGSSVQVHLKKQFPDTVEVRFEVPPPVFEDLLKKFNTTIDDGVVTTAEEKGDGMQRALMLAIIQAYADWRKSQEDVGKSFAFFIDEAELHLHPLAQRKLKIVLETLGDDVDH